MVFLKRFCFVSLQDVSAKPIHPRCNFHMKRRDSGSTPVVGSSKKTQRGSPTKDKPKESFRRVPPEKEKACLSLGAQR